MVDVTLSGEPSDEGNWQVEEGSMSQEEGNNSTLHVSVRSESFPSGRLLSPISTNWKCSTLLPVIKTATSDVACSEPSGSTSWTAPSTSASHNSSPSVSIQSSQFSDSGHSSFSLQGHSSAQGQQEAHATVNARRYPQGWSRWKKVWIIWVIWLKHCHVRRPKGYRVYDHFQLKNGNT